MHYNYNTILTAFSVNLYLKKYSYVETACIS